MAQADLTSQLKNVSERDLEQIRKAQEMLGPDPTTMGFVKNLFWGNIRQDQVFPYPTEDGDERARCDALLAELDAYLRDEHPSVGVDQDQEIPQWCIQRLFDMGVMGMIIPREFGGGGYGVTSYNRVLERIGRTCGSTAVMVSAHQSIGCGAIKLFGNDEQQQHWLPRISTDTLSAFCLSEPTVGCDAQNQQTTCVLSDDGTHYLLNGEKKWATSGARSGMLTVMARCTITDPKTGKEHSRFNALIVTPDMEGVDVFSANRAKCGIRGTWQARIRFTNVKVPVANLLHEEGKGINVALTCLNWGRCTLSAGMVGAGRTALDQATKWSQYRVQFDRPIGEFDLVKERLARMSSWVYAMESMLYMTTGIIDREDEDIMLETAICKVFCSEYGYRCADDAMQIMGGEGYMTENELERIWRDSRINTIVEGANEVMHSFIFAYGSKQLGEFLLGVRAQPLANIGAAIRIAMELFMGVRRRAPRVTALHPSLAAESRTLSHLVQEFSHQVKLMFKERGESLVTDQMTQQRLSWVATWLFATSCILSRLDRSIRTSASDDGLAGERAIAAHALALGRAEIEGAFAALRRNTDDTMRPAAAEAWRHADTLPTSDYYVPEATPITEARGSGKTCDQSHIQQFEPSTAAAPQETTTG